MTAKVEIQGAIKVRNLICMFVITYPNQKKEKPVELFLQKLLWRNTGFLLKIGIENSFGIETTVVRKGHDR